MTLTTTVFHLAYNSLTPLKTLATQLMLLPHYLLLHLLVRHAQTTVNVQIPEQYQDPHVPGIENFVLLVLLSITWYKSEFKQMDYQVIVITHQRISHKSSLMTLLRIGFQLLPPIILAMLTPNQLWTLLSVTSRRQQIQMFLPRLVLQILEHHKTPLGVWQPQVSSFTMDWARILLILYILLYMEQ